MDSCNKFSRSKATLTQAKFMKEQYESLDSRHIWKGPEQVSVFT